MEPAKLRFGISHWSEFCSPCFQGLRAVHKLNHQGGMPPHRGTATENTQNQWALRSLHRLIPDFQVPGQTEGAGNRSWPADRLCGSPALQWLWRSPGHQKRKIPIRSTAQSRDPHEDFFVGSSWNMCSNGYHICVGHCARPWVSKSKGNERSHQTQVLNGRPKRASWLYFHAQLPLWYFFLQWSPIASIY